MSKSYLYVVESKSLTKFVALLKVPNFEIGRKVCNELSEIFPDGVFTLVGDSTNYRVPKYDEYTWKFQQVKH